MRTKRGERVLGPYAQHNGFRVIVIDAQGNRTSSVHGTEQIAQRYIEILQAEISTTDLTTATALDEFKLHLTAKGNKAGSIETTVRAIEMFFPTPVSLRLLSTKRCAALYEALRTTPRPRTGKPPSADTHRNALREAKSFLRWAVKRGLLAENPLAEVEGIGKRRPRGKSLGKDGNTLRVREARAWYRMALELAARGDQGAIAALVAMLLGMRASEIVSRRVHDLDEDEATGDILWIPCAKTPAGRRTLEVPGVLRPLLAACTEGKTADRYLFEMEDSTPEASRPHWRCWVRHSVRRICDLAKVSRVTAHALRGLLATLTAERGMAGHLIAATLGHTSFEGVTAHSYAAPGSAAAGARRRGWAVLDGGVKAALDDGGVKAAAQ